MNTIVNQAVVEMDGILINFNTKKFLKLEERRFLAPLTIGDVEDIRNLDHELKQSGNYVGFYFLQSEKSHIKEGYNLLFRRKNDDWQPVTDSVGNEKMSGDTVIAVLRSLLK